MCALPIIALRCGITLTLVAVVSRSQWERDLRWDGRDHSGRRVSGGDYFLRLEAEGEVTNRRVLLLR